MLARRGPGHWSLFGAVTGMSCKDMLELLGWATCPACSTHELQLCLRKNTSSVSGGKGSLVTVFIPSFGGKEAFWMH